MSGNVSPLQFSARPCILVTDMNAQAMCTPSDMLTHSINADVMASSTDTLVETSSSQPEAKSLTATIPYTDARTLFDDLSATYSNTYQTNKAQRSNIESLISMLPVGSSVLDVGCGDGVPTTKMLSEAGMSVTGIDISPNMIATAQTNAPLVNFKVCDMRNFGADPGEYDAIVSIFSTFNMPTSAIREMAFKMAHWLKPGGLLLLGTIDFTDVPKAAGYEDDVCQEWLNHEFMGQVIKDNVFGVGEWMKLLRSSDISLVEAQSSTFVAKDGDIALEPECFLIGRKGDKDALLGPYATVGSMAGLPRLRVDEIERQAVLNLETAFTSNGNGCRSRSWSLSDGSTHHLSLFGIDKECHAHHLSEQEQDFATADHFANAPSNSTRFHGQLADLESLSFVAPAPYNDVVCIINEVATFLGFPALQFGPLLQTLEQQLEKRGYHTITIRPIDNEYISLTQNPGQSTQVAALLARTFGDVDIDRSLVEVLLENRLAKYFASQKHLGGREDRIGFQRFVLSARRNGAASN